jgi:hypothetical protein
MGWKRGDFTVAIIGKKVAVICEPEPEQCCSERVMTRFETGLGAPFYLDRHMAEAGEVCQTAFVEIWSLRLV